MTPGLTAAPTGYVGSRHSISPLILECARAHPNPAELRRLSSLCSDWDGLIESAAWHGITPLVFWALNRACPEAVPPEALTALRSHFRQNVKHNFLYTKELFRILDLFDRGGIQAIPFKGPALAWTLYETPGLRIVSDLDLLVPRRDVNRAIDLLTSAGHRRCDPCIGLRFFFDRGQLVLRRAGETLEVDLHWRLAAAHFNPLDATGIRARLAPIDIAGRQAPAFSPEDLLAFLCVHGAKHAWSWLSKLCDLDRLIDASPLDWDAILERAARQRMTRILSLGLCLAQDLLGSNLPPEISSGVHADARAVALAACIRERLLDGREWSSRELLILRFRLIEGAWGKLRFLWYYLHPTSNDWTSLGIPESIFPIYYLIRPVRLAWGWCLRPILARIRQGGSL